MGRRSYPAELRRKMLDLVRGRPAPIPLRKALHVRAVIK
jgi:hypothetical protein